MMMSVQELPVNPTPSFMASWMKFGMRINPSKYAHFKNAYDVAFDLAKWFEMKLGSKYKSCVL